MNKIPVLLLVLLVCSCSSSPPEQAKVDIVEQGNGEFRINISYRLIFKSGLLEVYFSEDIEPISVTEELDRQATDKCKSKGHVLISEPDISSLSSDTPIQSHTDYLEATFRCNI